MLILKEERYRKMKLPIHVSHATKNGIFTHIQVKRWLVAKQGQNVHVCCYMWDQFGAHKTEQTKKILKETNIELAAIPGGGLKS